MHIRILRDVYMVGGQDSHLVYLDWDAGDGNVYIVDTGDTQVLIDCGCGETLPMILENIKGAEFDLKDISHLILTHEHFPHAAGADAVQRMGVEVVAAAATVEAWGRPDPVATLAFRFHREPVRASIGRRAEDDEIFTVGRCDFRFLLSPGHSAGGLSVLVTLQEGIVLFSGDTVLPPVYPVGAAGPDADPALELKSLRRLLDERPDVVLPGHGWPCLSHGHAWIESRIAALVDA
jgi:glyoxylase-like metal-dependent hydrolase (beta-lactamase superfamily II)